MKRGVDYIGVGIGVVVVNQDRKLLLSKRGPKAQNERGKWEFPGGAVEFGETFEDTVRREMREEYGIEVEITGQLSPFNHYLPDEHQHWVALCFICKLRRGEPKILEPEKCERIGWFTPAEIEKMPLTIPARQRLGEIRERLADLGR